MTWISAQLKISASFLFSSSFLLNANFSERNRPETRSIDHFECDESRQTEAFRRRWLIWGFRSVRWFESTYRHVIDWEWISSDLLWSPAGGVETTWRGVQQRWWVDSSISQSSATLNDGRRIYSLERVTMTVTMKSTNLWFHKTNNRTTCESSRLRGGLSTTDGLSEATSNQTITNECYSNLVLFFLFRLLLFSSLLSSRLVLWIFVFFNRRQFCVWTKSTETQMVDRNWRWRWSSECGSHNNNVTTTIE